MKKVFLTIALAATLFLSSCIGSFNLTKKCYLWNQSIGDKWINELVFIGLNILPVYDICVFADVVVLNLIEFWTGNNPVSLQSGVVNTEKGEYLVEANENGYTITKGDETVQFINENGVWYMSNGTQKVEMFQYVDDTHVCLNLGETTTVVELSQAGVDNFRAQLAK